MTFRTLVSVGAKTLALGTALLVAMASSGAELQEFSAYYEARTNGISGDAERHLVRQENGDYRLNVSLEARMVGLSIGELEQVSEFSVVDGNIVPSSYRYEVSGVTSSFESVDFNWELEQALSREEDEQWTLDLSPGVLDQLSYQLALALTLGDAEAGDELEFDLVDTWRIRSYRFRVLGEEVLETALGRLNTVKLERVRDDDSGRETNIWVATDWNNLLARIEQINPGGLRIELSLKNAVINDEPVTPLP